MLLRPVGVGTGMAPYVLLTSTLGIQYDEAVPAHNLTRFVGLWKTNEGSA
jgi:hypothetical protein